METRAFATPAAFSAWLAKNHHKSEGIWLKLAKKATTTERRRERVGARDPHPRTARRSPTAAAVRFAAASGLRTSAPSSSVWENDWHGHINSPKGGDRRTIPMTDRLWAAFQQMRHLRGELTFCGADGEPWTRHTIQLGLNRICRRAGLRRIGAHVLRHTFCSHLAMRWAAPKAIKELAGHKSMKVTMRYMHLTESALRDAIRLLDGAEHRAATSSPDGGVTAR